MLGRGRPAAPQDLPVRRGEAERHERLDGERHGDDLPALGHIVVDRAGGVEVQGRGVGHPRVEREREGERRQDHGHVEEVPGEQERAGCVRLGGAGDGGEPGRARLPALGALDRPHAGAEGEEEQGIEHRSPKAGVVRSNRIGGTSKHAGQKLKTASDLFFSRGIDNKKG